MWGELAKEFGLGVVFLSLAAWLIRKLMALLISRDLEEYKSRLAAAVQRSLLEHEVRFRSLYAKRAEAILELHAKLARTVRAAEAFISPVGFEGDADKLDKHQTLMRELHELFNYFDETRILLDKDLDSQLETCIENIRRPTWEYSIHVWHPGEFEGKYEDWKAAWDSLRQGEIRTTIEALRADFRKLLGVPVVLQGNGGA